eukprot:Amastigsp_a3831_22.p2 type:complete len:266 gc:universal Amastigsp_a3831_22:946-1743(+)
MLWSRWGHRPAARAHGRGLHALGTDGRVLLAHGERRRQRARPVGLWPCHACNLPTVCCHSSGAYAVSRLRRHDRVGNRRLDHEAAGRRRAAVSRALGLPSVERSVCVPRRRERHIGGHSVPRRRRLGRLVGQYALHGRLEGHRLRCSAVNLACVSSPRLDSPVAGRVRACGSRRRDAAQRTDAADRAPAPELPSALDRCTLLAFARGWPWSHHPLPNEQRDASSGLGVGPPRARLCSCPWTRRVPRSGHVCFARRGSEREPWRKL